MTRKHFEAIAQAISEIKDPQARTAIWLKMAEVCAGNNPRFNRARFKSACGV